MTAQISKHAHHARRREAVRRVGRLTRSKSPKTDSATFQNSYSLKVMFHQGIPREKPSSSGKKADVLLCVHRKTGVRRAVKIVEKEDYYQIKDLKDEIELVQSLDHPNIIQYLEVFEGKEHCYVVMELAKGQALSKELDFVGKLDEQNAATLMKQVLDALAYCHSKNIVHDGIHPSHILLTENSVQQVKLTGFGCAQIFGDGENKKEIEDEITYQLYQPYTGGVTRSFWSPEFVRNKLHGEFVRLGPERDIWACGVLAYLILFDRLPFSGLTSDDVCVQILAGNFSFDDTNNPVSDEAKDFILQLLKPDQDVRITAREALQHKWILEHTGSQAAVENSPADGVRNIFDFIPPYKLEQVVQTIVRSQMLFSDHRKEIDKHFQKVDTDGDGRLSKEETRVGYMEYFGRELSDVELDKLFENVDVSKTGYIEYVEFVAASLNEKADGKLKEAFDLLDKGGNGFVPADDLKQVLSRSKGGGRDKEFDMAVDKLMKHFDEVAKEGKLSYTEFFSLMLCASNHDDQDESVNRIFAIELTSLDSRDGLVSVRFSTKDFIARRPVDFDKFYQMKSFLGKGSYGEVFLCVHKVSGRKRAVKCLELLRWNENGREECANEFQILKQLDHPNILAVYDLFEDEAKQYVYTCMTFCQGGDLQREIATYGPLSEENAAILMFELLSSLNYVHGQKVVHRDLKPANILLETGKEYTRMKLADFGLARPFQDGTEMTESCGTPSYMAPEVYKHKYDSKCDIWSAGVIAYFMLSNSLPFKGNTREDLASKIVKGEFTFDEDQPKAKPGWMRRVISREKRERSNIWDTISDDAKDFVKKLLIYEPSRRPSAKAALDHRWLSNVKTQTQNDPTADLSVLERLHHKGAFAPSSRMKSAVRALFASQLLLADEKAAIDKIFKSMDTNCDGKLTKDELNVGYHAHSGKLLSDDDVEALFARLDVDKTGYIEYNEFVTAVLNESILTEERNLRHAFAMFDVDHDHLICASDLKKAFTFYFGRDAQNNATDDTVIERLIMEVDYNGDGRISFEEFKEMMTLASTEYDNSSL